MHATWFAGYTDTLRFTDAGVVREVWHTALRGSRAAFDSTRGNNYWSERILSALLNTRSKTSNADGGGSRELCAPQ